MNFSFTQNFNLNFSWSVHHRLHWSNHGLRGLGHRVLVLQGQGQVQQQLGVHHPRFDRHERQEEEEGG